jgi:cytochrome c peroxidase
MVVVNVFRRGTKDRGGRRLAPVLLALLTISISARPLVAQDSSALGKAIFEDKSLSRDGRTSCSSCHDPTHGYADARPTSAGVGGTLGTRNAPSLIGIAEDSAFFWDGRRSKLSDAVLDAFTNPVELDLVSADELIQRIRARKDYVERFRAAFPRNAQGPTAQQVAMALTSFIGSLKTGNSDFDRGLRNEAPLSPLAARGREVFDNIAHCSDCHTMSGEVPRFTDDSFHFSTIGSSPRSAFLSSIAEEVVSQHLTGGELGPKVLSDPRWSSMGRFAVSLDPRDIGSFKTPSLRNVARTPPYMHDGSVATLEEAVSHEIYYRNSVGGQSLILSVSERQALIAFLESLDDFDPRRR